MIIRKTALTLQCLYCESLLPDAGNLYEFDCALVECSTCHRMNDFNSLVSVATCDQENAMTPVLDRQLERLYGFIFKRSKVREESLKRVS